jgi:hypothetical protein
MFGSARDCRIDDRTDGIRRRRRDRLEFVTAQATPGLTVRVVAEEGQPQVEYLEAQSMRLIASREIHQIRVDSNPIAGCANRRRPVRGHADLREKRRVGGELRPALLLPADVGEVVQEKVVSSRERFEEQRLSRGRQQRDVALLLEHDGRRRESCARASVATSAVTIAVITRHLITRSFAHPVTAMHRGDGGRTSERLAEGQIVAMNVSGGGTTRP